MAQRQLSFFLSNLCRPISPRAQSCAATIIRSRIWYSGPPTGQEHAGFSQTTVATTAPLSLLIRVRHHTSNSGQPYLNFPQS